MWSELNNNGIIAINSMIENVFTAIVSRIAHGDKLKEVSVQDNAPKLAKVISLLDTNWAEKILFEALTEIFTLLDAQKKSLPDFDKFNQLHSMIRMIYLMLNITQEDSFTRKICQNFYCKEFKFGEKIASPVQVLFDLLISSGSWLKPEDGNEKIMATKWI